MKIQSIGNNVSSINNYRMKKTFNDNSLQNGEIGASMYASNPLVDTNYASLAVNNVKKSNNVAFSGAVLPFEDISNKFRAVISRMEKNEFLIMTDNIKNTVKGLKDTDLSPIKRVVKRMYAIEDSRMENSILAYKDEFGTLQVMNIGNNTTEIMDKDGKLLTMIDPGFSAPAHTSSTISNGEVKLEVKYGKMNQQTYDEGMAGVQSFPLTAWDPNCIEDINKKHLKDVFTLFKDAKIKQPLSFASVGGQDKAIAELKKSVIFPLKYPDAFQDMHNRGIILYGPPGTGKTMVANATANEAGVNFIKVDPNAQQDMYVGESERKWREIFENAVANQPCILFIDEADAAMRKRTGSESGRFDDKIVNQLLVKMNEITEGDANVFVILATNKVELLDSAITRSGRFGKHIELAKPDLKGCRDILQKYSDDKPFDKELDKEAIAKMFYEHNCTGSDFPCIIEQARDNAYERLHFLDKMENGTFNAEKDMKDFSIKQEDFSKAFESYKPVSEEDTAVQKEPFRVGFKKD
ncbi:ATP-binding protein [bacterium]|nr:ATP-binding protein [bacterium]